MFLKCFCDVLQQFVAMRTKLEVSVKMFLRCFCDVLLQFSVMRSKLEVIEKMLRVGCGVCVVDAQLAEWLSRILAQ